jgi:hypothetical protein
LIAASEPDLIYINFLLSNSWYPDGYNDLQTGTSATAFMPGNTHRKPFANAHIAHVLTALFIKNNLRPTLHVAIPRPR